MQIENKENRKIVISGNGVDTKGNGNAEMKMSVDVNDIESGGVKLDAAMEVTVNGKIAMFGSRLIDTVSNQLFKQFVSNFSNASAVSCSRLVSLLLIQPQANQASGCKSLRAVNLESAVVKSFISPKRF